MPTGPRIRPAVTTARECLSEGREKLQQQHQSGSPGVQVCARLTDLLDTVLLDLYDDALVDLDDSLRDQVVSQTALVPHGGYGRRDVAPFSDVDLMLLCTPEFEKDVAPFARRLTQNIYDAGLQLGFSVRTISQACRLAVGDVTILTSLMESRFLGGNVDIFSKFTSRFRRDIQRRWRHLAPQIQLARRAERLQYGETVYLLEPNIKRSRGSLRDIQLARWIGFVRFGMADPSGLQRAGALSQEELLRIVDAREFLLRLRNELHFHADKSYDILDRDEQLRLAEWFGYEAEEGLMPVEKFMRDYFQHTGDVRYTVTNFVAGVRHRDGIVSMLAPLFSHQVEGDFRVGPIHISATRSGHKKLHGDLAQVLRLMDLANLYNKRIDHPTWDAIRRAMTDGSLIELTSEARRRFLSLLTQPAQLGGLLRRLHQLRVLEKIIPAMRRARGLLQFNEYHKYTVDEHSIRAVERAVEFADNPDTLGRAYRSIKQKRTLHLALLIHDLGKGFVEDHSDVGARLAVETAEHLQLPPGETEVLKLLVHKHLLMSHLAQRRDIEDPAVAVQLAVEVGSPEVLKMLYVLTCADLAAVGPGVLNQWKLNLLSELYRRTLHRLSASEEISDEDQHLQQCRRAILAKIKDPQHVAWCEKQIAALPAALIVNDSPQRVVELLQRLRELAPSEALAWGKYVPQRNAVEYTVGTYEQITPGVFHKLTGVLSSNRMEILAADIHTLADNLVLDRFYVNDMDFSGEPPVDRLDEVSRKLVSALTDAADEPPTFGRVWQARATGAEARESLLPTRVRFDNSTSDRYTIIDIFAHDRVGLLYAITRTFFQLGVSVSVAKIGSHLDQVVDVFYVTDRGGQKIEDDEQLDEIRRRLLEKIESLQLSA